jgi:hypothetical protein
MLAHCFLVESTLHVLIAFLLKSIFNRESFLPSAAAALKCSSKCQQDFSARSASNLNKNVNLLSLQGEKRANAAGAGVGTSGQSGPNEIVACTSCGGDGSPCTHTANNGCPTEVVLD